jgi:hypothetical protein
MDQRSSKWEYTTPYKLLLLLCVLAVVPLRPVAGVTGDFVPDEKLTSCPIVVVARWKKTAIERHGYTDSRGKRSTELRTEIEVDRVIKGDIQLGRHVIIGRAIGNWTISPLVSGNARIMMAGDYPCPERLNLWFLDRHLCQDPSDHETYLCMDIYRGIQSLSLEPYYRVLRGSRAEEGVGEFLSSQEELLVIRCLEYICGEAFPWPYERPLLFERRPIREPFHSQAWKVERLLKGRNPRLRRLATSALAALSGKSCAGIMRQLLSDRDPVVAAIALGTLTRQRDMVSVQAICETVSRIASRISPPHRWGDRVASSREMPIDTGEMGFCSLDEYFGFNAVESIRVIEALANWGDPKLIPAILPFLDKDGFVYLSGYQDIGVPALKAQAALQKITGVLFPTDVQVSVKAWTEAKGIEDRNALRGHLQKVLETGNTWLTARLTAEKGGPFIKVKNESERALILAERPSCIYANYGSVDYDTRPVTGRHSFFVLKPAQSCVLKVRLGQGFTSGSSGDQAVALLYLRNGNEFGVNAWVGAIEVSLPQ